jgi:hypothetical protein
MVDVYYERLDSDDEITREDVAACGDIAQLQAWRLEQAELSEELAIMLRGVRTGDGADGRGLAWRLGCINISIHWIDKRLRQLGSEPDNDAVQVSKWKERATNQAGHITRLLAENQALKAKLAELGQTVKAVA